VNSNCGRPDVSCSKAFRELQRLRTGEVAALLDDPLLVLREFFAALRLRPRRVTAAKLTDQPVLP
jgi:hypothetical protein